MADIQINSSSIESAGGVSSLLYDISIVDDEKELKRCTLRYTVDAEYEDYLCNEVSDGIVVTLLSYAMRGGYDIKSLIPMTERLYYTLSEQLIPQLLTCNDVYHSKIIADIIYPDWKPTGVATAMSCGVDSFATFFEYSQPSVLKNYRITHLTYFQNGAHHSGHIGHSEDEENVYNEQLAWVKRFCDRYDYKLIVISSNIDEFLSEMFWEDSYDNTHSYRNAGFVLLLQKLIKTYYYSPAHDISELKCSMTSDAAQYERLILPNVSSEFTSIYNSSGAMTRIEKIQFLSQFSETHDALLVCYMGGRNCGKCLKCKRTLVELDVTGVLELYKDSFDLDSYKKNRRKYMVWCLSKRHKDDLMRQIHEYIKLHNVHIPYGAYFISNIRAIIVAVIRGIQSIFRNKSNKSWKNR